MATTYFKRAEYLYGGANEIQFKASSSNEYEAGTLVSTGNAIAFVKAHVKPGELGAAQGDGVWRVATDDTGATLGDIFVYDDHAGTIVLTTNSTLTAGTAYPIVGMVLKVVDDDNGIYDIAVGVGFNTYTVPGE